MNIIGTGLSGLVGSRIVELLPHHSFENLSLETGVDITKFDDIASRIRGSSAKWIFHFAAYTDVQGAEKEKALQEKSASWIVNVEATKNIAALAKETNKNVLYLSTDYVFDGKNPPYSEESVGSPEGWYARTKYEGEKNIIALGELGLVVRIANPYRANPVGKKDFMHKILERLQQRLPIAAPNDQQMTATFIDDLAAGIDALLKISAHGVYNIPGKDSLSPYDAALCIAKTYELETTGISKTTFAAYFANRAPIPQFGVLTHDKIEQLGVKLHTFDEGVKAIKQMEEN